MIKKKAELLLEMLERQEPIIIGVETSWHSYMKALCTMSKAYQN